jgi:hypothetical protein
LKTCIVCPSLASRRPASHHPHSCYVPCPLILQDLVTLVALYEEYTVTQLGMHSAFSYLCLSYPAITFSNNVNIPSAIISTQFISAHTRYRVWYRTALPRRHNGSKKPSTKARHVEKLVRSPYHRRITCLPTLAVKSIV